MSLIIYGAFAMFNMACAFHLPPSMLGPPSYKKPSVCPKQGLPEIVPIVIEQAAPSPMNVGLPLTPAVIDHHATPFDITYFGKPYVINHRKSAALNVLNQTPVVIDSFIPPVVNEVAAPPAVIVEEVSLSIPAPGPAASFPGPAASFPGPAASFPGPAASFPEPEASFPAPAAPPKPSYSYPCH